MLCVVSSQHCDQKAGSKVADTIVSVEIRGERPEHEPELIGPAEWESPCSPYPPMHAAPYAVLRGA